MLHRIAFVMLCMYLCSLSLSKEHTYNNSASERKQSQEVTLETSLPNFCSKGRAMKAVFLVISCEETRQLDAIHFVQVSVNKTKFPNFNTDQAHIMDVVNMRNLISDSEDAVVCFTQTESSDENIIDLFESEGFQEIVQNHGQNIQDNNQFYQRKNGFKLLLGEICKNDTALAVPISLNIDIKDLFINDTEAMRSKSLKYRFAFLMDGPNCESGSSCDWTEIKSCDSASDKVCNGLMVDNSQSMSMVYNGTSSSELMSPMIFGNKKGCRLLIDVSCSGNGKMFARRKWSRHEEIIGAVQICETGKRSNLTFRVGKTHKAYRLVLTIDLFFNISRVSINSIHFQDCDSFGKDIIHNGIFCLFNEMFCKQLIIEEKRNCNFIFVIGDPSRNLKDKYIKNTGGFLYTDRKLCGQLNKATFKTKNFKQKVIPGSNLSDCQISITMYGDMDTHWMLSVCSNKSCSPLIRKRKLDSSKDLKTFTGKAYPPSDFYLKFRTGVIFTREFIGIHGLHISEGCLITDRRQPQTSLTILDTEFDGKLQKTDPTLYVVIVSIFAVLLSSIAIYVIRRRRQRISKYLNDNTETNMLVEDLLTERLSEKTRDTMVMQDNPNYLWYSKGMCGCITKYDSSRITIENLIGYGEFGHVYKATMADKSGNTMVVALKQIHHNTSENTMADFLLEAIALNKLHHKNIVQCYGISSDKVKSFILLEFMTGGDMLSFLRLSRDIQSQKCIPNPEQLLQLALDIADGCNYLAKNHFIHRDIAARNCLLTRSILPTTAKIGDFGMARSVAITEFYKKEGLARVPIRWMPPESYQKGIFTSKSDVWSYGILLWEIYTLGYIPYPGLSNENVMTYVSLGKRLGKPNLCTEEIYDLMLSCWSEKPGERCTFQEILTKFSLIRQDCSYNSENNERYITILDYSPEIKVDNEEFL